MRSEFNEDLGFMTFLAVGAVAGFAAARWVGLNVLMTLTWAALGFTWAALFIGVLLVHKNQRQNAKIRKMIDQIEQRQNAWLS